MTNLTKLLYTTLLGSGMVLTGCTKESPIDAEQTASPIEAEQTESPIEAEQTESPIEAEQTESVASKKSIDNLDIEMFQANMNVSLFVGEVQVPPKEGTVFVETTFEITNRTGKDLDLATVESNFFAEADGKEDVVPIVVGDLKEGKRLEGTLKDGESATGYITWQAPEDFKKIEVEYIPDWMSEEHISFTISR